jgi:hypothetical protein
MENNLQNLGEVCETQQDAQMDFHNTNDENKAKLDGLALEIEVDHAVDNVSTLQDIELPSEEIFDDRTVGFSTIEFCTVYENNLYGTYMETTRKSSSIVEKKTDERDVESAYISEPSMEGCTPIIAESQLYGSFTDDSGCDKSNCADDLAITDERVEAAHLS